MLVIAIYAMAALSVAYGHKATTPAIDPLLVSISQSLPGGMAAILCADDPSGHSGQVDLTTGCDACLLTTCPGLVPVAQIVCDREFIIAASAAVIVAKLPAQVVAYAQRARGPPASTSLV